MPYTMQSLKNTDKRERQPMREDEGPHDELTTDREAPAVGPQYRHGAKMSFFAEAPPVGSICQGTLFKERLPVMVSVKWIMCHLRQA